MSSWPVALSTVGTFSLSDIWRLSYHHVGLIAGTIMLYTTIGRVTPSPPPVLRFLGVGVFFGCAAIFVMAVPADSSHQLSADTRYAMLALSSALGGPLSGLVTVLMGSLYRLILTGQTAFIESAEMALVGLVVATAMTFHGQPGKSGKYGLPQLLTASAVTAAVSLLCFAAFRNDDPSDRDWIAETFLNTAAILTIGLALKRLNEDIARQSELRDAVEVQSQLALRHQVVTNNVADGVFTLDQEGIIHSFNSSAEWIFGWVGEDVIGRHVSILLPNGSQQNDSSPINSYLETGKAGVLGVDGSLLGHRRNGERFPVELRLAEFTLGGSRFFAASARDLSSARAAEQRRAAAERLSEISRMRFRDCATASSDYLWETDSEHRFTFWIGGQHLVGLYPHAVLGRKRWDVAGADFSKEPWLEHLDCLAFLRPYKNFIFSMPHLDGKTRWYKSSGVPFFNEDGTFGGYRGASSDITDAVEAERQLTTRAERQQHLAVLGQLALQDARQDVLYPAILQVLVQALTVSTAVLLEADTDRTTLTTVAAIDREKRNMTDLNFPLSVRTSLPVEAFFAGEPVVQRVEPPGFDSRSDMYAVHGMAAGIGDIARRSGVLLVCDADRNFDSDEKAFLQAVAVIVGTAVERRRAEASLALRDRALESIGQGLVIADAGKPGFPAVYVNSAFALTRSRPSDELIAADLGELFSGTDGFQITADLLNELQRKGQFSACLRRRQIGFDESWMDVVIKPVGDSGRLTHYVCVQTDVTSRIKLESELRQAQKMDAVGKLTGGVAHDFNNLLTVILGNAELLSEDLVDPDSKLTAELILDAAERGSDLVQRLLTFGRRQALQPEYVDVDECVANIAALLKRTIGEDILLVTDLHSSGSTTFIDKSHLETAILNLGTNARDAMAGGGTLTIATRVRHIDSDHEVLARRPGRYISLTVKDTGSGIPPEVKQRVFEPFFTTKQFGKGTGLGLSSVYGFVQQSSGHIELETELGRGTLIEILLPCVSGVADHEEASLQPTMITGRERVLIVEDQADVRDYVASQLNSFGYDVIAAATSADALATLETDPGVRLLFTDILLPAGMDGFQLAENALRRRPDLRILFTSGYSDYAVERQSRLLELGIPLLKKPYRKRELAAAIRGALERGYTDQIPA